MDFYNPSEKISAAQGDIDESLKLLRRLEPLIVKLEA